MPLLLLLLLIFACHMENWQKPFDLLTPTLSAALTGVTMASVVLLAWLMARWVRWALHRFPDRRDVILRRYGTWRRVHFFAQFAAFGLALYGFGWGWALKPAQSPEPAPPGIELLLLAPFLATLALSWCCFYDSERVIHDVLDACKAGLQVSPAGQKLSFLAPDRNGILQVWMQTKGMDDARPLTADSRHGIRVHLWAYAPDTLLYLQDTAGDGNWHLYSVQVGTGLVRDLTPFPGSGIEFLALNRRQPDAVLVGMSRPDRPLADIYRIDLTSGALVLDLANPGDVQTWEVDDSFRPRPTAHVDVVYGDDALASGDRRAGGESEASASDAAKAPAKPVVWPSRAFCSRAEYVILHARQSLGLILVPMLLVVILQGLERLYPDLVRTDAFQLASLGLLIGMLLTMPAVLRLLLGLRSLPPGPLRRRLDAAARRLQFQCRDILVWNTWHGIANALVLGLWSRLRYVVLTDRLLTEKAWVALENSAGTRSLLLTDQLQANLSPSEVEAVFGHEMGHVKHHHMLFYCGFLMISLAVLAGIWQLLAPHWALVFETTPTLTVLAPQTDREMGQSAWLGPLMIGSLVVYIFVVFGFLSRRCERQADIYGCRAVSCGRPDCQGHEELGPQSLGQTLCPTGIKTFISALEKVAILNGISRSRPGWLGWLQSWQHSTIASRVEFLQRMLADPGLEPRFQRRVRLVKWVLMIGLCTMLGVLTWTLGQRGQAAQPGPGQAQVESRIED